MHLKAIPTGYKSEIIIFYHITHVWYKYTLQAKASQAIDVNEL